MQHAVAIPPVQTVVALAPAVPLAALLEAVSTHSSISALFVVVGAVMQLAHVRSSKQANSSVGQDSVLSVLSVLS